MTELLIVAAIALYGASSILQKRALQKVKTFSVKTVLSSHLWISSLLTGGVGTLAYLGALRSGQFAFIQTALAATFVIPIIGGTLFLKERLTVMEWISVCLISIGIIVYSV